jgi:hypothetical protein
MGSVFSNVRLFFSFLIIEEHYIDYDDQKYSLEHGRTYLYRYQLFTTNIIHDMRTTFKWPKCKYLSVLNNETSGTKHCVPTY